MKRKISLLLSLVFAAMLLCACGAPAMDAVETPPLAEPSPETAKEEKSFSMPEDIVFSVYEKIGSYTDMVDNEYEYIYRVPAFNSDSEDAVRLNGLISDELMKIAVEESNNMALGVSLICDCLDYEFCVSGTVVSVVCHANYPNDVVSYRVYSLEAETGREFTNADFASAAGMSLDELSALAADACADRFIERYAAMPHDDFYDTQLAMTIAPENFGENMMLFYDNHGTLVLAAPIYSLAGASYYYEWVRLIPAE